MCYVSYTKFYMVIAVFRYNRVELGRACPKSFPEPCPKHGVVTEHVPWSDGKRPVTVTMMCFLSRRARGLSWRETARVFGTSWDCVYRSVGWYVEWGVLLCFLEARRPGAQLQRRTS
jgi:hypothetical protein